MILIVGGAGQGKLDYVLHKTGLELEDVAYTPEEAKLRPVFYGVERWTQLDEEELLSANPNAILICQEVGCGVVPVDVFDRRYRETVGRVCTRLAAEAKAVYRVVCGIGAQIK